MSVWTDDAWNERALLSRLNQDTWWALKAAGVTIAFPQRDLHVDSSVLEAFTAFARGGLLPTPPVSES